MQCKALEDFAGETFRDYRVDWVDENSVSQKIVRAKVLQLRPGAIIHLQNPDIAGPRLLRSSNAH